MPRHDETLLLDMLIACRKIRDFTQGMSQADFEKNELVQSAVIREFQVLGEAARMISEESKTQYDSNPWPVIAGTRNRLIHEYFDIRIDVVWETVQENIPDLTHQIQSIIPPEDKS